LILVPIPFPIKNPDFEQAPDNDKIAHLIASCETTDLRFESLFFAIDSAKIGSGGSVS
jgi:hypothetical protein